MQVVLVRVTPLMAHSCPTFTQSTVQCVFNSVPNISPFLGYTPENKYQMHEMKLSAHRSALHLRNQINHEPLLILYSLLLSTRYRRISVSPASPAAVCRCLLLANGDGWTLSC